MGNCFTVPSSRSLSASSHCSSWRSNSLYSDLSCDSGAAISRSATKSSSVAPLPPRRILPFSTPRDLDSHYQLGQELGKGQFGLIRVCRCRASGTLYACKSISKLRTQDLPDILREVLVMQRLSLASQAVTNLNASSSIVRLHQVVEDDSHVHLIMELCCGGELFHRIVKKKCFQEREAALIIKSLMESIQFCHSMGVIHRDIKPENILFLEESESSCIKLADFGLASEIFPG
ncbi:hypothetical protein KP509_26G067000 [Ceratopteris richardii]|nr:hypothetical protein KP509_26G067000 [Ceratopteris richardii]